jgi:sulfate transport system substrate-binding protein
MLKLVRGAILGVAAALFALPPTASFAGVTLLNVSYDPTGRFYQEFNKAFAMYWRDKSGERVGVRMSHGGSGKQARTVIDGLDADVVTLALATDIDAIAENTGKIPAGWRAKLPNDGVPYTSTIVFLVRKGNPKSIADWGDLAKPGVQVITPNPKTSGGARWNYLAAYGWALDRFGGDEAKAKAFLGDLYRNVPVLDTGARGSTTTFAQRGLGDVLLTWENEAFLVLREFGRDRFELVTPSASILAEPSVALVDGNVDAKGTRAAAEAYLKYWYTREGQEIAARNSYRPRDSEIAKEYEKSFAKVELFTIDDVFGGWTKAQKDHFGEGGIFDQIYKN